MTKNILHLMTVAIQLQKFNYFFQVNESSNTTVPIQNIFSQFNQRVFVSQLQIL